MGDYIFFIFIFLSVFLIDMDNSDYTTQDDTSDSDYGEDETKNENDVFILATVVVEFVKNYYMSYIAKETCRTSSHTSYKWVIEILKGNPVRCKQNFRIEIYVFIYLCKELKERYHLRCTRKLTVEELVAIFLSTLGYGFENKIVQEMFQYSRETVSRHFTHVLMAVLRMTIDIINPIDRELRMFQAKFVMMSDISYISKIVLEPLMEPMCQLKFLHQTKYHILVENGLLLRMLWLFVIFVYIFPLFRLDGKVLDMIHVFFWKLFKRKNYDFHTHLKVYI
jgi:hypothetical protein